MMARPRIAMAMLGAIALLAHSGDAQADGVQAGKGAAGGAFLGADVVTIVEALVGVRAGWAYGVGALVGAGGGGVGGYLIGNSSSDGKVPTYILAGGLGLIIPALVLTFNATRYLPEEGATEDKTPVEPAAEPGVPGGSVTRGSPDVVAPPPAPAPGAPPENAPTTPTPPQSLKRRTPAPGAPVPSLVGVNESAFRLGVPVPDIYPTFSAELQRQYGMRDIAELRLPVLHVTF
jgi:hypothetical protein